MFTRTMLLVGALALASSASAQEFAYQGRYSGVGTTVDIQAQLFDAPTSGSVVGTVSNSDDVLVSNNLFTTTFDFGAVDFAQPLWLEIRFRDGASTDPFAPTSPLVPLIAVPAANYALNAGNALALDGIAASEFVTDTELSTQISSIDFGDPLSSDIAVLGIEFIDLPTTPTPTDNLLYQVADNLAFQDVQVTTEDKLLPSPFLPVAGESLLQALAESIGNNTTTPQQAIDSIVNILNVFPDYFGGPGFNVSQNEDIQFFLKGKMQIGLDANASAFGNDVFSMRDNNIRMFFSDTSIGSFPSTDWRIGVNDSMSNGENNFFVDNVSNGTRAFQVSGSAPDGAFTISEDGFVGINTENPVSVLDVRDNLDNPVLIVEKSGNVGIGTDSPAANLDINGSLAVSDSFTLPQGNPSSPVEGMIRYNSTLMPPTVEFFDGSTWNALELQP